MKGVIALIEPRTLGLDELVRDAEVDRWRLGQSVQSGCVLVA
jgi:hypothetical protein